MSIDFIRDAQGRITKITHPAPTETDPLATAEINYDYDSRGDLIRQTDQAGRYVDYNYFPIEGDPVFGDAPDHFLYQILDPNGNQIRENIYDGLGRLSVIADALGNQTNIIYEDGPNDGEQIERRLRDVTVQGTSRTLETITKYNSRGNVLESTNENNIITTYVYGDDGNPDLQTQIISSCSCTGTTSITYDENGNALTIEDALNGVRRLSYDNDQNLVSQVNELGQATNYIYNSNGKLLKIIDSSDRETNLVRDSFGRVVSITDTEGRITQFRFAQEGEPVVVVRPTKVIFDDDSEIDFEYNAYGQVTKAINQSGDTQTFILDNAGVLIESRVTVSDPTTRDIVVGYDYNERGELTSVTKQDGALNYITTFEYDLMGRLRYRRYAPDPAVPNTLVQSEYQYDEIGRLIREIDELGRTTEKVYRNDGLVERVIQPYNPGTQTPEDVTITFEYDDEGRRTAIIDPSSNRTEFRYDLKGRLTDRVEIIDNGGSIIERTESYEFDLLDNLKRLTDRNGKITTFDYDNLNRLIKETWINQDGVTVVKEIDFSYDSLGNLDTASDDIASFDYDYDNRNRVDFVTTTYTGEAPFTLDYSYNDLDRRQTVTDGTGVSVQKVLDERGLLTNLVWQGGAISSASVRFVYNDLGDLTDAYKYSDSSFINQIANSEYTFNRGLEDNGMMARIYNANGNFAPVIASLNTETFGPLGVQKDIDDLSLSGNKTLSRLSGIGHKNSAGSSVLDFNYIFDDSHQLDFATENGETIDYSYDLTGQLTNAIRSIQPSETYEYDNSGNRESDSIQAYSISQEGHNRYDQVGNWSFVHDNVGNLVNKNNSVTGISWVYQYDHRNRLVSAERFLNSTSQQLATYDYDFFDRRIRKSIDGSETVFYYKNQDIWKETTTSTDTYYLNGAGVDNQIARYNSSSGTVWYLKDRLGSVSALMNNSGSLINENKYASYGVILNQTSPNDSDRYLFAGREYDAETGLYYYRARYYDPEIGRFISQDPMDFGAGDYSLYRYVNNAPTNYTDPSGLAANTENGLTNAAVFAAARRCAAQLGIQLIKDATINAVYLYWVQGNIYAGKAVDANARKSAHVNNPEKVKKIAKKRIAENASEQIKGTFKTFGALGLSGDADKASRQLRSIERAMQEYIDKNIGKKFSLVTRKGINAKDYLCK